MSKAILVTGGAGFIGSLCAIVCWPTGGTFVCSTICARRCTGRGIRARAALSVRPTRRDRYRRRPLGAGSPDYERLWGRPDERAWERAHEHFLSQFGAFSDVQDARPVHLPILEAEV